MRLSTFAFASAVFVGTAGSAQEPRPLLAQQPPFRSGVDVVQLDVSVIDKDPALRYAGPLLNVRSAGLQACQWIAQ